MKARYIGRITGRWETVAYWILQANPKMYRVFNALIDAPALRTWTIAHHKNDIQPGDEFALWVSGRAGGVYAFGVVTSPAAVRPGDSTYWVELDEYKHRKWRIGIRIEDVLDSPIPRRELSSDLKFAGALILRMPGGGNPFPLSKGEWQAILSYRRKKIKDQALMGTPLNSHQQTNVHALLVSCSHCGAKPAEPCQGAKSHPHGYRDTLHKERERELESRLAAATAGLTRAQAATVRRLFVNPSTAEERRAVAKLLLRHELIT
jgi:hypothetical protein